MLLQLLFKDIGSKDYVSEHHVLKHILYDINYKCCISYVAPYLVCLIRFSASKSIQNTFEDQSGVYGNQGNQPKLKGIFIIIHCRTSTGLHHTPKHFLDLPLSS